MKFYTGIGSRNTPEDILEIMSDLAFILHKKGWTLRSGGADGADLAFEEGVKRSLVDIDRFPYFYDANIYIPWKNFRVVDDLWKDMYIHVTNKDILKNAEDIASQIHPNWKACSRGAKALHTRNIFQVIGHWYEPFPSKFVICWAPISGESVTGGTRTAVEFAKSLNIEVFNLAEKKSLDRVLKMLEH